MILFILIAIGIALYTIFVDWGLYNSNKNIKEINAQIKENIKYCRTNYNTFSLRKYNENDYTSIPKNIFIWFLLNISLNICNFIIVWVISLIVVAYCPKAGQSYYTFNINSLKDNLVTSGEIHGSAFCVRGKIDGEISYFFSRTTDKGEIIEHIPANKSYIKYDDDKNPCIEVHEKNKNIPGFVEKLLFIKYWNNNHLDYYVIIVPTGTFSSDRIYNIDME